MLPPAVVCCGFSDMNSDRLSHKKSHAELYRTFFRKLKKQVRPNDVWICVACSYFIYQKIDIKKLDC